MTLRSQSIYLPGMGNDIRHGAQVITGVQLSSANEVADDQAVALMP